MSLSVTEIHNSLSVLGEADRYLFSESALSFDKLMIFGIYDMFSSLIQLS